VWRGNKWNQTTTRHRNGWIGPYVLGHSPNFMHGLETNQTSTLPLSLPPNQHSPDIVCIIYDISMQCAYFLLESSFRPVLSSTNLRVSFTAPSIVRLLSSMVVLVVSTASRTPSRMAACVWATWGTRCS